MKKQKIRIDVGCGKNKQEGYTGVDIDPDSGADIIASALSMPFSDESVDEIFCRHLVEHFIPDEAKIFFAEIYRVLKKGGRATLKIDRDWAKKRLLKKDLSHKHRYSVKEIKNIIARFDFRQSEVKRKIYLINLRPRNKIFVKLVK